MADIDNNVGGPVTFKECGKSKGCYRYPTGCEPHDCEHILTWMPIGEDVVFELDAKITDDNDGASDWFWTAVGFSRDLLMVCVKLGQINMYLTENNDKIYVVFLHDVYIFM